MNNISIEIPSLMENIRIVESFVDNTKDKYDLTDDVYGNIMVAVIESVNNAIVHGNQSDKEKNVQLSAQFDADSISFKITDEGNGFDVNTLPDPTSPENLEKTGGRGIFLMKHLSDEVAFENLGLRKEDLPIPEFPIEQQEQKMS
jgi:serine/threonine-protein kinase RsbW